MDYIEKMHARLSAELAERRQIGNTLAAIERVWGPPSITDDRTASWGRLRIGPGQELYNGIGIEVHPAGDVKLIAKYHKRTGRTQDLLRLAKDLGVVEADIERFGVGFFSLTEVRVTLRDKT